MYKCTNVQMYKCTNVQIYKYTNIQMYKCTNVQLYKIYTYTNVQMCKYLLAIFMLHKVADIDDKNIIGAPKVQNNYRAIIFIFSTVFLDRFIATFSYCSSYSYRSFKYRHSNSCCSFSLLKAIAKTTFKSEKEIQIAIATVARDIFTKRNRGKKQRN